MVRPRKTQDPLNRKKEGPVVLNEPRVLHARKGGQSFTKVRYPEKTGKRDHDGRRKPKKNALRRRSENCNSKVNHDLGARKTWTSAKKAAGKIWGRECRWEEWKDVPLVRTPEKTPNSGGLFKSTPGRRWRLYQGRLYCRHKSADWSGLWGWKKKNADTPGQREGGKGTLDQKGVLAY